MKRKIIYWMAISLPAWGHTGCPELHAENPNWKVPPRGPTVQGFDYIRVANEDDLAAIAAYFANGKAYFYAPWECVANVEGYAWICAPKKAKKVERAK